MTNFIGTLPKNCQHCKKPIKNCFYDAKLKWGSWAYICPRCHKAVGVGVGVGKGQKYIKNDKDQFFKVEG